MIRYIFKRLLASIAILLAVIFVIYGIVLLAPGDPATIMLGTKATPEAVAELNAELGYDQPFLIQYLNYLADLILRHDMGTSFKYGTSVWEEIALRFPKTLTLAAFTIAFQVIIAVLAGVICVRCRGKLPDKILSTFAGITTAIPSYASGLLLMLVFSVWLGVTPIYGTKTWTGYILPIATLVLSSVGFLIKTVRSVLIDSMNQDFVRTARALGESEQRVMYVYAVRNALLPIVTTSGYQFAALLGGTVVTETIFSVNGVGSLMVTAVIAKDIPLMLGITVCLTAVFCLVQLLMEISYFFIDPRVRAKYGI